MRKMLLLLMLASFVFTVKAQDHNDHDKPRIEGSGNLITRGVNVQSFDELYVSGIFSVALAQGDKEDVKIEAEDNLQSLFIIKNEGSRLSITMNKDTAFNTKKKMKVYITFKKLKSMDLKTIGNVSSDQTLKFDDLKLGNKSVGSIDLQLTARSIEIENKSVGDVKLKGSADNVIIKNNSVGSIQASGLMVQTMDIDNKGVGSAEVNAAKEVKIRDSGMSRVTNRGTGAVRRMNRVVI